MPLYQTGVETSNSITTGTAEALTMPAGERPTHAIIQVQSNSIRWRADGTAPTATVGLLVAAGTNIEFMDGAEDYTGIIHNFQAIGISGTAVLNVAYFAK
jgi:hypothetical protein